MTGNAHRHFYLPAAALIGYGSIDSQHAAIIGHLNLVFAALRDRADDAHEIARRCREFKAVMCAHFAEEEKIMAATGYPGLERHCLLHNAIRRKLEEIVAPLSIGMSVSIGDVDALFDAVIDDVLRSDLEFKAHLDGLGLIAA